MTANVAASPRIRKPENERLPSWRACLKRSSKRLRSSCLALNGPRMIALRQLLLRRRHVALLLLALAFSLRALIPQGMMASPDGASGGITVLLCDGTGSAMRLALPLGEKPGKVSPAQSCPFAVLAQAGTADAPGAWVVPLAAPQALPHRSARITAEPRQKSYEHPPARAPPASA